MTDAVNTVQSPGQTSVQTSGQAPGLDAAQYRTMPWLTIIRFGLVQASLGSIVVLMTSTLNRVMVVELGLAAIVPGLLVALHYVVQLSRPRMGHGSDIGGKRTPWIIGGMAVLAIGAVLAATSTLVLTYDRTFGFILATLSYCLIGFGVSASGTSLLALVAKQAGEARSAPAAMILWLMMIAGIAITAGVIGALLDPFSFEKLVRLTAIVGAGAVALTTMALWRLERLDTKKDAENIADDDKANRLSAQKHRFLVALKDAWGDAKARHFTIFVFVSMLAYSCQDLVLEPFGGLVFGMTPGETTTLASTQHQGAFLGMVLVGVFGSFAGSRRLVSLKAWTVVGCMLSGFALLLLPVGGANPNNWSLPANVFALGFANGMFTIGAIGMMMRLAGDGPKGQEGMRMGLWGAAQAIGFGIGGFLGTVGVDVIRYGYDMNPLFAYGSIFGVEALTFFVAAAIAAALAGTGTALTNSHERDASGSSGVSLKTRAHSVSVNAQSGELT